MEVLPSPSQHGVSLSKRRTDSQVQRIRETTPSTAPPPIPGTGGREVEEESRGEEKEGSRRITHPLPLLSLARSDEDLPPCPFPLLPSLSSSPSPHSPIPVPTRPAKKMKKKNMLVQNITQQPKRKYSAPPSEVLPTPPQHTCQLHHHDSSKRLLGSSPPVPLYSNNHPQQPPLPPLPSFLPHIPSHNHNHPPQYYCTTHDGN